VLRNSSCDRVLICRCLYALSSISHSYNHRNLHIIRILAPFVDYDCSWDEVLTVCSMRVNTGIRFRSWSGDAVRKIVAASSYCHTICNKRVHIINRWQNCVNYNVVNNDVLWIRNSVRWFPWNYVFLRRDIRSAAVCVWLLMMPADMVIQHPSRLKSTYLRWNAPRTFS